MNPLTKIVIGALATTALAWWLNGPMKFGEKCADNAQPVATTTDTGNVTATAAPAAPATAEAVADCQTKVNAAMTGKTINFQTSGAGIAPESMALIDTLATELKACAGTTVEIAGHTDSRGSDEANMRLSEARASAVAEALVNKGVPTDRLVPKGYGETAPVDPALTQDAYAKNRRTEFKISSTGAAAPAAGQ